MFKDHNLFISSNFLGISPDISKWDRAYFIVLPVPYDSTTTFQPGTRRGPRAIIEASAHMELYDEELCFEPASAGIHTLDYLDVAIDPEETINRVYHVVGEILKEEKVPVVIGGEHSVTLGAVNAVKERYNNLSVIQLDAHADLRDTYQGERLSHACVMRRISEKKIDIIQVGIRSMSKEEAKYLKDTSNILTYYASDILGGDEWMEDLFSRLSEYVYVTVDVDVFDPAFVPSTGTPEPGGLGWYKITSLLRRIAEERKIVGFDVMELCPIPGNVAPDFLVAKLVYKLMGYTLKADSRGHDL